MESNINPDNNNAWLVNNTLSYYSRVRQDSEIICENLEIEDFGIQTMPEVSPPKWHLAHTSWFFETMLLKPFLKGYSEYNSKFAILFNSYYDTIGQYHPRAQRGLLSRPTVSEVYQYRRHVDVAMIQLLSQEDHVQQQDIISRTVLGVNHEQQHQELLLTDIKHIFASNPLQPIYKTSTKKSVKTVALVDSQSTKFNWIQFEGGVETIGYSGNAFSYDNEGPRHKTYLNNFELASRAVTNGEFIEFINDGGYQHPALWLSDAWKIVNQQQWQAPLYWQKDHQQWYYMTFDGLHAVDEFAPVCHVSYYEAAAYTRWLSSSDPDNYSGLRLPTEAEWEVASMGLTIKGNFRDSNIFHPQAVAENNQQDIPENITLNQMFGDVWEWTQSAYAAYPGYFAEAGPLGEYNGKFMSSQMVLRGGSCITPIDHIRATYRNFFCPHERWQFSGFRLARDLV